MEGREGSRCATCGKKDKGEVDQWLQCEICEDWYHCECENISDNTYNTLKNEKTVHWYCTVCNKGVVKVLKNLKLKQLRRDKMDEDLGKINWEMAEIKGEMTQIKTLAMETGNKLETAIEAKLLES